MSFGGGGSGAGEGEEVRLPMISEAKSYQNVGVVDEEAVSHFDMRSPDRRQQIMTDSTHHHHQHFYA
jgi:hypothetical protein